MKLARRAGSTSARRASSSSQLHRVNGVLVGNVAEHKESFVSNRRQYKRHVRDQWTHGQASRAVDGNQRSTLHSCTLLDNFYVDRPVWMVDLGVTTTVSGVVIVTWQQEQQQHNGKSTPSSTVQRHSFIRSFVFVY